MQEFCKKRIAPFFSHYFIQLSLKHSLYALSIRFTKSIPALLFLDRSDPLSYIAKIEDRTFLDVSFLSYAGLYCLYNARFLSILCLLWLSSNRDLLSKAPLE
ncbi:hypothetical protein A7Q09_06520 [Methylacidiphilum sp. Yel]|nr:hypothetical protein A7Q09_06520 [Methylacidiphilum sp. Yel]